MSRYTDVQTITFNTLRESRALIVNGSVDVAVFDGVDFIDDSKNPLLTDTHVLFTKGLRVRFTPTGGSSYLIEEGDQR